jgi:hypothetical protein
MTAIGWPRPRFELEQCRAGKSVLIIEDEPLIAMTSNSIFRMRIRPTRRKPAELAIANMQGTK